MGEVVNLREARKRRKRAEKDQAAAENRAKFGRTKGQKQKDAADAEKSVRDLEGHRRDPGDAPEDDGGAA